MRWTGLIFLCLITGCVAAEPSTRTGAVPTASRAAIPAEPTSAPSNFHIDMRQTERYLASDALEGRRIGTPGIALAGTMIADDFAKLGLEPLPGQEDYFQRFEMVTNITLSPRTFLKWKDHDYKAGVDFALPGNTGQGTFDAPVVFAGYGVSSPADVYDDFAGLDVRGKVVMVLRFEPHKADGTSWLSRDGWSPHASIVVKAREAAKRGATALVLVNPPKYHPGDILYTFSRGVRGEVSPIPIVQVSRPVANDWLNAAGLPDLETLQSRIDTPCKPASADLPGVRVSGCAQLTETRQEVRNVLAMLPGKGPLASEYVIVGAHYDHLGHGGQGSLAPGSHDIFHGADDNASGTTTMLEIADHFAHQGPQQRTLVFAAWTAEEEGLIGSAYFTGHPLVPLSQIVADLNLDMVGRVKGDLLYIGGAGTAPAWDDLLAKSDVGLPFQFRTFGRGGFGPSDHMSFALKKIPVLFLFSGMHPDYHRPTDTADKINFTAMDQVAVLAERLVLGMAELPRQTYVDANDSTGGMHVQSAPGEGASLGVVPDYSNGLEDASIQGVKISGTVPGSPAALAGLKDGDVLVEFGKEKIDTLYDLSDQLAKARAGEHVVIGVLRGKEHLSLQAVLAARHAD